MSVRSRTRVTERTRHVKRLVMLAVAALIAPLIMVTVPAGSAYAASCKPVSQGGQPSSVWIGGLHNEGIISSANPTGTISVPIGGNSTRVFYTTGIVPAGTSITFDFAFTDGHTEEYNTDNADSNCVVHFDHLQNEHFGLAPGGSAAVYATYVNWQTGQRLPGQFIGTLNVGRASGTVVSCPNGLLCGAYPVNGLGSRKQQVLNAGAHSLDLAVAMLETETIDPKSYPYGDTKTGDAANFGIFKQNWLMLRTACTLFQGQADTDYNDGAVLNTPVNADATQGLMADINCLHQSQGYYGISQWFLLHRQGPGGLVNPDPVDLSNYESAVEWIAFQLNSNPQNLSNNTRFWVQVRAI